MRRKNTIDILDIVSRFQKQVSIKPPLDQMYDDIRMMRFKIRPLQGDISLINLTNKKFIEILWSLGKLDDFFQNHIEKVSRSQREFFFKLVDEMYEKYQEDLNTIDLKREKMSEDINSFEMEIFKEKQKKDN